MSARAVLVLPTAVTASRRTGAPRKMLGDHGNGTSAGDPNASNTGARYEWGIPTKSPGEISSGSRARSSDHPLHALQAASSQCPGSTTH